jgi:DNA-binding NarL/FixJ family response regulator
MLSLLIVEDNAHMRRMIRTVVAGLVDAVHECDDGAEAPAVYAAHQPDWVLMDVEMARVDGITATREITTAFPGARILIVTQYDDARICRAALEAGARGCLLKENLWELRGLLGGSM